MKRLFSSSSTPRLYNDMRIWHCIVHLKLMNAFARLRGDVRSTSSTYLDKSSERGEGSIDEETKDNQVWKDYVQQASKRFEVWWLSLVQRADDNSVCLVDEPEDLFQIVQSLIQDKKAFDWTEETLPPLDVLMILHTFMLNPHCFLKNCTRYDMLSLWITGMPFHLLDVKIDTAGQYNVSSSTKQAWQTKTGLAWTQSLDRPSSSHSSDALPESRPVSSDIFHLDLAAAVHRQTVFIDQMAQIDWLHSPALPYTIAEILRRYQKFFQIIASYPTHVAVPTHAVDLAWHTHQLDPELYHTFSTKITYDNRFIDHDDRIQEDTRNNAFEWTCEQYKKLSTPHNDKQQARKEHDNIERDYTACLCWYCSTCLQELSTSWSILKSRSKSKVKRDEKGHVLPISKRMDTRIKNRIAQSQYQKLEDDYEVICVRAGKNGMSTPSREEFFQGYTWLYPHARPMIHF